MSVRLGMIKIFDLRWPIYDWKNRIAKRRKIEHEPDGEQKKIASRRNCMALEKDTATIAGIKRCVLFSFRKSSKTRLTPFKNGLLIGRAFSKVIS